MFAYSRDNRIERVHFGIYLQPGKNYRILGIGKDAVVFKLTDLLENGDDSIRAYFKADEHEREEVILPPAKGISFEVAD